MTTKAAIESFFSEKVIAVAGVSRDRNKFGNMAYRELKARGIHVLAINPNVESIESDACYPSLNALPERPGGLVVVTQPAVSEQVVRQAQEVGIANIWLQQGSESATTIQFCQEHHINVVAGECIMMFMPRPAFPHSLHKFIKTTFGAKPT